MISHKQVLPTFFVKFETIVCAILLTFLQPTLDLLYAGNERSVRKFTGYGELKLTFAGPSRDGAFAGVREKGTVISMRRRSAWSWSATVSK